MVGCSLRINGFDATRVSVGGFLPTPVKIPSKKLNDAVGVTARYRIIREICISEVVCGA